MLTLETLHVEMVFLLLLKKDVMMGIFKMEMDVTQHVILNTVISVLTSA